MATDLRLRGLDDIDPESVALPHGTEVVTRVDRLAGERRIPQGAVGRVVKVEGDRVEVAPLLPALPRLRLPAAERARGGRGAERQAAALHPAHHADRRPPARDRSVLPEEPGNAPELDAWLVDHRLAALGRSSG